MLCVRVSAPLNALAARTPIAFVFAPSDYPGVKGPGRAQASKPSPFSLPRQEPLLLYLTFIKKFSLRVSERSAVWNHLLPQTEHSMMRPLPRTCRARPPRGRTKYSSFLQSGRRRRRKGRQREGGGGERRERPMRTKRTRRVHKSRTG